MADGNSINDVIFAAMEGILPKDLLFAFSLTLLAGLCTGIGGVIAFFSNRTNPRFLALSLGFSAGMMIYLAMIDLFPLAKDSLVAELGEFKGYLFTTVSFFGGILLIGLIDKLIPGEENPHEPLSIEEKKNVAGKSLYRTGLFSALAIAIHNFLEGLATFTGALQSTHIGISIAFAIAIHNIPEGITISIPIYYSTGSRKKAIWFSFLSGLAEPLGALIGFFVFYFFFSKLVLGILFAAVGGIMVYISLDELLPTAEKYGEHHAAIYGLIAGMVIMAVSLMAFM